MRKCEVKFGMKKEKVNYINTLKLQNVAGQRDLWVHEIEVRRQTE